MIFICVSERRRCRVENRTYARRIALLRAGVQAVVASLWKVDDAATAYLMRRFHALLLEGVTPVTALARAQAAVRSQPGWDLPYYWAAFSIAGRGSPVVAFTTCR